MKASVLKEATSSMSHRGPDGEGYLVVGKLEKDCTLPNLSLIDSTTNYHLYFGHRRLSIQDTSNDGIQPLSFMERYWIVFNGEIYNFKEIRQELQSKGMTFKTSTDTEVVLASYHVWGSACVNRFNGMWAFVIFDSLTNEIMISRDRLGVKPLYYIHKGGCLALASEIKSIHKIKYFSINPDLESCSRFIEHGPEEWKAETLFHDVRRYPPTSYSHANVSKLIEDGLNNTQYWRPEVESEQEKFSESSFKNLLESFSATIEDAVKIRLRSDVPVGITLSGGLDSSIIAGVAVRRCRRTLPAFSTVYPSSRQLHNCDESQFVENIASFLKIPSYCVEPDPGSLIEDYKKLIYVFDTPPDSTCQAGWQLYKLVNKKGIKVTLDGQGGDELLGGYFRYIRHALANRKPSLSEWYQYLKIKGSVPNVLAGALLSLSSQFRLNALSSMVAKRLLDWPDPHMPLNARLFLDLRTIFQNLLHYSDRASMGASVESRMPFLDYRLVELMLKVPDTYKLRGGWTKFLAREFASSLVPHEIAWRKEKIGWAIPEKVWLKGALRRWSNEVITGSMLIKSCLSSHSDFENLVTNQPGKYIRLLNLAVWEKVFFGD